MEVENSNLPNRRIEIILMIIKSSHITSKYALILFHCLK